MKSNREKLAEGIISKLIDTFYTKKSEAYADLMMKADPAIGAATKQLQQASANLKKQLMKLNKKNYKWMKDNGIRIDKDGNTNGDDLRAFIKNKNKNR